MQLKYRGVSYDYTPPQITTRQTDVVGQYRGLEWRFRASTKPSVQQPTLNLVYRGVAYQTGTSQDQETIRQPVASPAGASVSAPVKELARALMLSHHTLIKNRQQSMLSRVAAEVGLGADAAHYWNHIQGKVHPGFRASYDRSHAALS